MGYEIYPEHTLFSTIEHNATILACYGSCITIIGATDVMYLQFTLNICDV